MVMVMIVTFSNDDELLCCLLLLTHAIDIAIGMMLHGGRAVAARSKERRADEAASRSKEEGSGRDE